MGATCGGVRVWSVYVPNGREVGHSHYDYKLQWLAALRATVADELTAEADLLASEREQGDTQFDEESGEGDTLSVERERDLALSTAARQTVDDIAKALARMDDGSYGYCEVCGDRIPVPRLEAIPWADQCVKCKSRGERRR